MFGPQSGVRLAIFGCLFSGLAGPACGSSPAKPDPIAPEPSSGETSVEEAPTPAEPAPVEAVPQGPGTVTIEASVRGNPVSCDVQLLSDAGDEVASGKTGQPLTAPAGEYLLVTHLTDKAVLLDTPTDRRPLTLNAGENPQQKVEFKWSIIQLNVKVNGTPEPHATVILKRQGALVGELKSGAEHVPLSPGRYDAQVKTRGAVIEVPGLMFPEGATQGVPVNVRM